MRYPACPRARRFSHLNNFASAPVLDWGIRKTNSARQLFVGPPRHTLPARGHGRGRECRDGNEHVLPHRNTVKSLISAMTSESYGPLVQCHKCPSKTTKEN